jgi:predicted branched-subunit amino acid permease
MKNTKRMPPIEEEKNGLNMFYELFMEIFETPRHIIFWNLVGFVGQAIFIYLSPELWGIAQMVLFIILIGFVMDKEESVLAAQSIVTYIIILIVFLVVVIYNIFKSPARAVANGIRSFNNWIDKK